MPSLTAKHGNEKPRSKPICGSDPKPNTHFLSHRHQSSTTSSSQFCSTNVSKNHLTKMPKKKMVFTWMALRGLGCRGISSPATLPAAIRPAPDREAEKLRKKKRKKKKHSKRSSYNPDKSPANLVVDVPEVCCTPPKFGFAYDVAPIGSERSNHRERFRAARQTANIGRASTLDLSSLFSTTSFSGTNESDSRQYHRLRQLPEIMMLHNTSLLERSLDRSDRFGDWRFNLDPLLYEELLNLSDRIGYVGAGLQEDEILGCLKKTNKHSRHTSLSSIKSRNEDWKCSICQEECKGNEDLGRLTCGHYHHIDCIKQWLLQKNECPLCKTAAVAAK